MKTSIVNSTNCRQSYDSRLSISLVGDPSTEFFSKSRVRLARGYDRVVLGGRGPYVEFSCRHLVNDSLREVDVRHVYYVELRSIPDDVKFYAQLLRVDYADYVPGKFYASPFEMFDESGRVLIERLRSSK